MKTRLCLTLVTGLSLGISVAANAQDGSSERLLGQGELIGEIIGSISDENAVEDEQPPNLGEAELIGRMAFRTAKSPNDLRLVAAISQFDEALLGKPVLLASDISSRNSPAELTKQQSPREAIPIHLRELADLLTANGLVNEANLLVDAVSRVEPTLTDRMLLDLKETELHELQSEVVQLRLRIEEEDKKLGALIQVHFWEFEADVAAKINPNELVRVAEITPSSLEILHAAGKVKCIASPSVFVANNQTKKVPEKNDVIQVAATDEVALPGTPDVEFEASPTILDGDAIRLKLNIQCRSRSSDASVSQQQFETTIEIPSGGSVVIGGSRTEATTPAASQSTAHLITVTAAILPESQKTEASKIQSNAPKFNPSRTVSPAKK